MSDNDTKKHSFVVLAHKDSPYLEDCLRSLSSQSIRSRIVVATSTPTARQRNLADQYGVTYVVNDKRKGIATDWDFALAYVDTQWVTLAHQDDIYAPDYAESMLEVVSEHQGALIAFSDYSQISGSGVVSSSLVLAVKKVILRTFFPFRVTLKGAFLKRLALSFGCPICCPTVMYNKKNIGGLLFDDSFEVNLDWKYWIDLAECDGAFVYLRRKLLQYRAHGDTTTNLAIDSGLRRGEDERCFRLLWPNYIAWIISRIYTLSYKKNSDKKHEVKRNNNQL